MVTRGRPRERLDAADDLRRVKGALEAQEARREICDANGVAAGVLEHRLDDRRVAHILARGRSLPVQDDVAEALFLVTGKQTREHGIGIEARKAPPHDAAGSVDQCSDTAVADWRDVEIGSCAAGLRWRRHGSSEMLRERRPLGRRVATVQDTRQASPNLVSGWCLSFGSRRRRTVQRERGGADAAARAMRV